MSLLKDLNRQGLTVIIITHDHEVAAVADRVVTFKDGQILSDVDARASTAQREIV